METRDSTGSRFSRRDIIRLSPLLLLAGCDMTTGGGTQTVLESVQKFNDWIQGKVFDPTKLAPEYTAAEVTPEEGFRVNGKDAGEPDIDITDWSIVVDGMVKKEGSYTLEEIKAFPKREMNTRHCCVEGWSMIPRWAGTPMKDFLRAVGADPGARYLSVQSADDYYTSYDMASALHPQTLLCYEAYGKPLTVPHGAPVRIVMPTKLGYKSAKWITKMTITNEKPGGYWEDQGYDWFAGI